MGIYGALQTAVSGLRAQSHAMENISGNIANSQTTGYKRIETSFVDLIPDAPVKSQVPGAVMSYSRSTNGDRGDIQNASTETYMALNGSGFFVVEPSVGDTSGTYYTRRGDFDLDKNGFLVNGAGFKLKGVAMENGVVTGSVPSAIKIDNSFLPAKRSTSVDYKLNLPQLPKNGAYVSTTPGSELMKPWNYAGATGQVAASGTGPLLPASAVGVPTLVGTAAANTVVNDADKLSITVGGTTRVYHFNDGTAATLPDIDISATGDINTMLAQIQTDLRANGGASAAGAIVQLVNGKVTIALPSGNVASITTAGTPANTLVADGTYTAAASTGATAPAKSMVSSGQTLTINVGGTLRTYVFDTDGTNTPGAGQIEINAGGTVQEMLDAIQADLRSNGGAGAAGATLTANTGGQISLAFTGNYTMPVTFGGSASGLALTAGAAPNPGAVNSISSVDADKFMKESITGGGITVYSKTGEPINLQMRWAKTSNEAGNETWSMFYASDTRPGAATPWTKVADYSFDQGVLTGITGSAPTTTAVGMEQVVFNNLSVNGSNVGQVSIDHGLKGITQFADNGGTATTTALKQNGFGAGEFLSVGINDQGRVVASYSNGETREVAQIVVANFNAPDQLKRGDGGTYTATSASGEPVLSEDGGIVGSSLEASNTDISEEFTKLIVTQQAYSANTRIVSAANDMLKETLSMIR